MIEGLNIRCNIGAVEVLRSPFIQLFYKRQAVLSRGVIEIPDPTGSVRAALVLNSPMSLRFGYRGGGNFWHEWQGTIEKIDQSGNSNSNMDAVIVHGVGLEKKLSTTIITESFYNEPATVVASRLLAKTGLPVAGVHIPNEVLPHQIFSSISVARAIKQLEQTLIRSFGHDLSKHAVWLGQNGLCWSAHDEPGAIYTIETAHNLLQHTPPKTPQNMGSISSVLLPGLTDSRQVHIRDTRRQINQLVRAEEVIHTLQASGNSTTVVYGKAKGWG